MTLLHLLAYHFPWIAPAGVISWFSFDTRKAQRRANRNG